MDLHVFLQRLNESPLDIEFEDTMAVIAASYDFTPTAFRNGELRNAADQNNGSCKILAFGRAHDLSVAQTLACFGRYYREDVLAHPDGNDHQNIRNFIKTGWQGVEFDGQALTPK